MVRHGEAPDPKADMMYPDGLGRVILAQVISRLVILGRVIHRIRRQPPLLSAFQPIMPCNKNIMPPALAHGLAQNTGLQSSSDLLGYR